MFPSVVFIMIACMLSKELGIVNGLFLESNSISESALQEPSINA